MTVKEMGLRTATTSESAELYAVCTFRFGSVVDVVETFGATPLDAKKALARRDEIRDEQRAHHAGEKTYVAMALRHDCDANAVPYVSDGALGHGWECGQCGAFLQAG